MGVYYHYVNFTKQERFAINSLGGGIKFGNAGFTPASRALHLLIIDEPRDSSADEYLERGRWSGDSIAVLGDDITADFDRLYDACVDIAADAILLVYRYDGCELLFDTAEQEDRLYMQLCHLSANGQAPGLMQDMKARFGASYLQRYRKAAEKSHFRPQDAALGPPTTGKRP
jgi:hypothetical protein